MTAIQSCAGGWCTRRDSCAHYLAASEVQQPSERLCPPGQDGAGPSILDDAMPHESIILNVPQVVARNPVARAVERANLRRWLTSTALQVQLMAEGEPCGSLLIGLCEAIGIALKATEGVEDPHGVRDELTQAMTRLVEMTDAGSVWSTRHAEALHDALDVAVQLLGCTDPRDKVRAWNWVRKINRAVVA